MTTDIFDTMIKNFTITQAEEYISKLKSHIVAVRTTEYKSSIINRINAAIQNVNAKVKYVFNIDEYTKTLKKFGKEYLIEKEHIICTLQINGMKKMCFDIELDVDFGYKCIIETNFMGNSEYLDENDKLVFNPTPDYRSYVPNNMGWIITCVLRNCTERDIETIPFIDKINLEPDDNTVNFADKAQIILNDVLGKDHKLHIIGIKGGFAIGGWFIGGDDPFRDMNVLVYDDHFVVGKRKIYADKIIDNNLFDVTRKDIFYINFPYKNKIEELMNSLLTAYGAKFRLL